MTLPSFPAHTAFLRSIFRKTREADFYGREKFVESPSYCPFCVKRMRVSAVTLGGADRASWYEARCERGCEYVVIVSRSEYTSFSTDASSS